MSGRRDLLLAAGAAIVLAGLAVLLPWDGARLVVALPLAFFLPGFAIVAGFGPRPLGLAQAFMLWLGCSLSVLCLGALVLNYTPGGVQTAPWAILLAVVTVLGCAAAFLRRRGADDEDEGDILAPVWLRPRPVDLLLGLAAVALAVGAVVLANTPLKADGAEGFTALWIDPALDGGEQGVELGVASAEPGPRRYLLMLEVGGGPRKVISRFGLRPDDEHAFKVALPETSGPTLVKGYLYRQSKPAFPLREVRLWLRSGGG